MKQLKILLNLFWNRGTMLLGFIITVLTFLFTEETVNPITFILAFHYSWLMGTAMLYLLSRDKEKDK